MQNNPIVTVAHSTEAAGTQTRHEVLASVRKATAEKLAAMPQATSNHDFLYDENGLPK